MLADLEGALEVEVSRAGGATGEATTVIALGPASSAASSPSRRVSVAGILLVLAAAGAALAIAALTGEDEKAQAGRAGGAGLGAEIELVSAEDFDPEGDDERAPRGGRVGDRRQPATRAWTTETYTAGPGLDALRQVRASGLIVDAGEPVARARDRRSTPTTGGWTGEVYGAAEGPPDDLAGWG